MRKTFILLLLMLFCFTPMAWANTPPQTIDQALSMANDEVNDKNRGDDYFFSTNKNNKPINHSLWQSRRLFVYGEPYGMDSATGNNRYLGETMMGDAYTNTLFRHDAWEGGTINERKWIPRPWNNDEVKAYLQRNGEPLLDKSNPFNNNPDYNSSIKQGIKEYFTPNGNVQIYFKDDATQWHQYVHVLQPPTQYTWGMGRMWHKKDDGSIWYLTVPMAPTLEILAPIPDFSVHLEVDRFKDVKPGEKVTSTVTYTLNKDHPKTERAWLRLHHVVSGVEYPVTLEPVNPEDTLDKDGFITFQPGESKTYQYTFTVQNRPSKILARINPVDINQDKDWTNNRDEAPIQMDNLWVEIIDYTKEAQVGGTATVKAKIHNDKGEMLTTRLVWKVNGVIMKDSSNYDLIGSLDDTLTFTMPKDSATVTVEINPDRDRPATELSYEDNKASCVITPVAVTIPPDKETGKLKINISEPSHVKPFTQKWSYTVTVTTDYPEPPPPPPGGTKPKPPTITMNVQATGQTADINIGYQYWNNGYQKIDPVKRSDKKVFSAGWGKKTHTFPYEYPATGLYGKPVTVTIKADASSSKGQTARDTAIVIVDPKPIKGYETPLTK